MISAQEIKEKNINPAMVSKESPALDLTRMFIGFAPRSKFKQGYMKSVKLSDEELRSKIINLSGDAKPQKIIPYMYDAYRRKIPIPETASAKYRTPDNNYLKELNLLSAKPAEKYVNAGMAGAGALTGVAALDYLLEKASPKYKTVEDAVKAGITGAELERQKIMGDAVNIGKFMPEMAKQKVLGLKGKQVYNNIFETNLSGVIGGGSAAKSRLMERLIGVAHNLPLTGIAAIPLLSRNVLKKLKGEEKGTKREKLFTWVEEHPGTTMGVAFAPSIAKTITSGGYDLSASLKKAPAGMKNNLARSSVARTGLNLGKLGLTMSIPLMYMKMRRHMDDARNEEQKLIDKTIIKKQEGKQ